MLRTCATIIRSSSREFLARPGHAYRLKARMKATHPEAKVGLMLQGYEAGVYFWANWPSELKVGTDWNDHEFVFRIPGPGEGGHHERMGQFRARVDFPVPSGALFVSEVSLHEIEMQDEWTSWQALGMDWHSQIADPKFVDAEHDDFRLEPASPAFALGFKPIPVDRDWPLQGRAASELADRRSSRGTRTSGQPPR